jgi:hypothetical protein
VVGSRLRAGDASGAFATLAAKCALAGSVEDGRESIRMKNEALGIKRNFIAQ